MQPQPTVKRSIEHIFQSGTLAEKYEELCAAFERGDSTLFDGAVNWRVDIAEEDKSMKGHAGSLDEAIAQMRNLLGVILSETDPNILITLSVKESQS